MAICLGIVIFFLVINYKPLGFAACGICFASGALQVCFVLFRRAAKPTFWGRRQILSLADQCGTSFARAKPSFAGSILWFVGSIRWFAGTKQ
jgi:hypothetical protein